MNFYLYLWYYISEIFEHISGFKLISIPTFSVAIDLIVQHIRDLLSNRLTVDALTLSPTSTPAINGAMNGARGKNISFNGDPNYRPH